MSYYREERKSSFVAELLLKLLLIVAFVCLLIWIFPTKKSLDPLYQEVFRNNLQSMRIAADSYFTNARMPKKSGDKVKLTLGEMEDKHLVLPFVDKYGKKCDLYHSYVEVTREDEEFKMKVNLACSQEEAYIIVYIGCNDRCILLGNCSEKAWGDEKTKDVTQYEFKKTMSVDQLTGYKCDSGWTLQGNKCYRRVEQYLKEDAIPIYSGESDEYIDATCRNVTTYTCPDSSWTNNGNGTCTKKATSQVITNYVCDTNSGWSKYGTNQCQKPANSTTSYNCGAGWTSRNNGTCTKAADTKYSCDGRIQTSSTCSKTVSGSTSQTGWTDWVHTETINSSNSGAAFYTDTRKQERTGSYWYSTCGSNPFCSSGYYMYTYKVYTRSATTSTSYNCGSGWNNHNNGNCTKAATLVYQCDGVTQASSTCTKTVAGTTNYSCPLGTRSGTTCLVPATTSTYTQWSCPQGGNLVGTLCQRTANENTTKICDRCTSGYVYDSSKGKCYRRTESVITGYKCSGSDWALDPDKKICNKTVYTNETEKATGIYKKSQETIYKWASTPTLAGWTATGKTRTVKVTVK